MLSTAITSNAPAKRSTAINRSRIEARRANRLAYLVVEGQTQGFHCTLREFSDEGAHLTVSGLMGIPEQFYLYVEPDAVKFQCSVNMRKGNSVKVSFVEREDNVRFRDLAKRR